jgi:RHS repeat-associated protein
MSRSARASFSACVIFLLFALLSLPSAHANYGVNFTKSLAGTLSQRQFPDGSSESFQYDSTTGAPSSWTPPGGAAINFAPNPFGQPTQTGTFATIGYDLAGRVNSLADAAGSLLLTYTNGQLSTSAYTTGLFSGESLSHGYNAQGQLQSVILPGSRSVSYTYTSGTLTGITTAGGESVAFGAFDPVSGRPLNYVIGPLSVSATFDGYGRNTSQVSTVGGVTTSYTSRSYDNDGHCYKVTAPEGQWNYGYNSYGFLLSGTVANWASLSYNFDSDGRPATVSPSDFYPAACLNSGTVQLIGSVVPGATVTINGTATSVSGIGAFGQTYTPTPDTWQTYDILAALSGTGAGKTAETVRTVFVPPRSENLGYDSAGDLQTTARWTFGWNELGQLTTITEADPFSPATATQINCTYDVQGHRVQKQVSIGGKVTKRTTTFWDQWRPAMETDYIGTSSTISAQRWYTWGPDVSGSIDGAAGIGGLIEILTVQGTLTTRSLPIYDGIGNIVGLIDGQSGARVATYSYAPFGELLSESGPRADQCPFRYQTKEYDCETGFYYFGKRYFDPKTQTWLNRDPIREQGGANLYAYCNDDPVGNYDAIGEDPNPLSDWERKMVGQDEQSAEAIIHRFDPGAHLTTPADILGNQLHTSSLGGNLGWMPFTPKWDLLSQFPNVAEPDVALLESTRENTVYGQYLLAQHGLLPKRQLQRLELRTYTGLLDLTTIAATIPFQVPSAASLPWIGSNLSTRIADTNALYAPINPMGAMKGPVVFTPPADATEAEIAEMQAYVQGANYAWRVGALSNTGRVTTVGVLRAASSEAAAAERSAASGLGIPYRGVVGHIPDTTWTGDPEAFSWLDQTARINSSLGGQAPVYPIGFKPTGFTLQGDQ